jgi:hypothetical protein
VTPTARSLKYGRDRGYLIEVVERWIPQARRRKDLFGCIDLVALDGRPGCLGVQATSGSNVYARVKKIHEECWPAAEAWLQAGNRLEVWGWRKLRGRWEPRIVQVFLDASDALEACRRIHLGADEPPA